jgi:transcription initiation factor IIE alpha subunit
MPTDEERREVAERLRKTRHKTCYNEEVVENIKDAISIADPVNTFREPEDVYELLADLIEPQERTCHNEATGNFFCCSECGTHFGFAIPRGPRKAMQTMRFCPSCGARITEVDDGE